MALNMTGISDAVSGSGGFDPVFLMLAFAVFVFVAFKALHVLKNTIFVAILSIAFPFVMNRMFSAGLDTSFDSLMFFLTVGVFLYIVYEGLKLAFHASKLFMGLINLVFLPFFIILKIIKWIFSSGNDKSSKSKKKENESKDKNKD